MCHFSHPNLQFDSFLLASKLVSTQRVIRAAVRFFGAAELDIEPGLHQLCLQLFSLSATIFLLV